MRFFFPDNQDVVDPSFDFQTEQRSEHRVRQRDDQYAHELIQPPPYDGLLVSKASVDGKTDTSSRYTLPQRLRLRREGAREFFRLSRDARHRLEVMGDSGAYSYIRESVPPFSVEDLGFFYHDLGCDYGLALDHAIPSGWAWVSSSLSDEVEALEEYRRRQSLTLDLAENFLSLHRALKFQFVPIGVAQGWDATSYSESITALQAMGYEYVALGGLASMETPALVHLLEAVQSALHPTTRVHLLGVSGLTRFDLVREFRRLGVFSFDTASPLRQALKDDKNSYFTETTSYLSIRVPQPASSPEIKRRIRFGTVDPAAVYKVDQACLRALHQFDRGRATLEEVLNHLRAYNAVCGFRHREETYRRVLEDQPWRNCPCSVCERIGIDVMLHRGAERSRRRGFHNLHVFFKKLRDG